jgi:signal peptidase I
VTGPVTQRPASPLQAVGAARGLPSWRRRHMRAVGVADRAASVVCGLAVAGLALLLLSRVAGYHQLIDRSDSMRPAIRAGDLLISLEEPVATIRRGQIVSFVDPGLHGRLITHRVIAVHAAGARIHVVTRGDANAAPESWSVPRQGLVKRLVLRIPGLGRALSPFAAPLTQTILLAGAALLLTVMVLRRIWKP